MLNTVMALWNQHPGANWQRIVKLCFTFLLISVSIFLLLFTLDGSAWSSVPEKEQIQTRKVVQVGMRYHNVVAIADETPVGANRVAGIPPTSTKTLVRVCIYTPTVVVKPSAVPQRVEVYAAVTNSLERNMSKPHHVRSKIVYVRKDRRRSRKRSHIKVIVTPVPQETVIIVPPPQSVTPPPVVTPVVGTMVAATPVPVEETPANSMPDIVTINLTPDIATNNSTAPFVQSLRHKDPIRISGSPEARSTKKAVTKKRDQIYEYVQCSGSTIHKHDRAAVLLKGKRRMGLFLGSPLLGIVLFCCFRFARKRKKFANLLRRFKISSKNA